MKCNILAALSMMFGIVYASASTRLEYSTEVVDVVDGNTIVISNKVFETGVTVRALTRVYLDGIHAPSLDQPDGLAAMKHLASLVKGKRLTVIELTGMKTHSLVWVLTEDKRDTVNEEMIKTGFAWARIPRFEAGVRFQQLQNSQDKAQKSRVGLWSKEKPIPPWEWTATHLVTNHVSTNIAIKPTVAP